MGYATSGIRNIALVGQAGAGKTSLVETLLLQAGAIRARGSLQRGTTVSDFDPQEKRLQHSLDTAICSFDYKGVHINLIDTPGYPDFLGKSLSVLEAVEAVAVVVSAVNGVDTLTQRLSSSRASASCAGWSSSTRSTATTRAASERSPSCARLSARSACR